MFISDALAQGVDTALSIDPTAMPPAPNPLWNFGMLVVMIVLFYVLLIMPQQKRFKEHSKMLSALDVGDRIVTGGGLVGKISKLINDDELEVDLGHRVYVTVRRSSISSLADEAPAALAVAEKDDKPKKKTAAKKTTTKKAATKKETAKKDTAKKTTTKKTAAKKTTATKAKKDA